MRRMHYLNCPETKCSLFPPPDCTGFFSPTAIEVHCVFQITFYCFFVSFLPVNVSISLLVQLFILCISISLSKHRKSIWLVEWQVEQTPRSPTHMFELLSSSLVEVLTAFSITINQDAFAFVFWGIHSHLCGLILCSKSVIWSWYNQWEVWTCAHCMANST